MTGTELVVAGKGGSVVSAWFAVFGAIDKVEVGRLPKLVDAVAVGLAVSRLHVAVLVKVLMLVSRAARVACNGHIVVVSVVSSRLTLTTSFTSEFFLSASNSILDQTDSRCGWQFDGSNTYTLPEDFSAKTAENLSAQSWYQSIYGSSGA